MTSEVLERCRSWVVDSICPSVRQWIPDAGDIRFDELKRQFVERTTSDASSMAYAKACPVDGVAHTAYRLREFVLFEDVSLIAGIHFKGMDANRFPFVGVFAQSRWLAADEAVQAHSILMEQFDEFSPRATWWWTRLGRELDGVAGRVVDQNLVVGSLHQIRKSAPPQLPPRWEVRRVDSIDGFGDALSKFYREFHAARTDLRFDVPAAEVSDLQECAEAGGLFGCFADGSLAGIVATQPGGKQYGARAWVVFELVLAREYCGKGLAPLLQRAAFDQLDAERAPLVLGTIDGKNEPSLRTALRVGRRIVGTTVFLRS